MGRSALGMEDMTGQQRWFHGKARRSQPLDGFEQEGDCAPEMEAEALPGGGGGLRMEDECHVRTTTKNRGGCARGNACMTEEHNRSILRGEQS